MITRLIGYLLLLTAILIVGGVLYVNSGKGRIPLIFSPSQMLEATWFNYKNDYVEAGSFRTIDTGRSNVTTSEGQSYTMLRAVWMGDKTTFDGAWKWTQTNIYHTQDHLFAWLWGKKPDGSYGVLTAQGGETTASDADTDIALSLVFAYARWQDPKYLDAARGIIQDIWNKEVIDINGKPYLVADDLEKASQNPYAAINPSYFNPAAYRIFAKIDTTHAWGALVDDSYNILQKSTSAPLDKSTSAGLPPDWIQINKTTGALSAIPGTVNTTNFGYDAMRVPFRLALDWLWFHDARDVTTLRALSILSEHWTADKKLASTYSHDGTVIQSTEASAFYGGTIGYFMLADTDNAKDVYEQKLVYLYDPGSNKWKQPLAYYDDNWAWFGIALYNNRLPNLTQNLPDAAFSQ